MKILVHTINAIGYDLTNPATEASRITPMSVLNMVTAKTSITNHNARPVMSAFHFAKISNNIAPINGIIIEIVPIHVATILIRP